MSGHLLQTMNPEAVRTVPHADLPKMGSWVTYVTRPGEGRRGRNEFPALVMATNDTRGPNGLDLLIVYDAQDVVYRDSVQSQSEQQDSACWLYFPDDDLTTQVKALREELATFRDSVFGEWNEPKGGMMEYLVDFEKRVKLLEADVKKAAKK